MNLRGKKVGAKNVPAKPDKIALKRKTRGRQIEQAIDEDDELVTPEMVVEDVEEEVVQTAPTREIVPAFKGGFVHPSLQNAVNAHWRKSPETVIFLHAMKEEANLNNVYIGAIYIKSSFVRKTGGSALL